MKQTRSLSLGAWLLLAGALYAFLWPALANLALPDSGGGTWALLQGLVVSRHLGEPWNTPGHPGDSSVPGIGAAFWLSPFYCLAHLGSVQGGCWPPDGKNPLYRLGLAFGSSLALLLALMVLARLLVRRGWSPAGALGLTIAWTLSGPVGWHATFGAGDPHAVSFLLASALVVLWMTGSDDLVLQTCLVGALALVHPPDLLFALLLLPALRRQSSWFVMFFTIAALALMLVPQVWVWRIYPVSRPVFDWTQSGFLRALLSPAGGLLGAYPVMAVALIGIFFPFHLDANTCRVAAILTGNLLWIAATPRSCVAPVDPRWLSAGPFLLFGLAHLVEKLQDRGARAFPMVLMAVLSAFGLASSLAANWAAHGAPGAPVGALAALGASGTDLGRVVEAALRPGEAFQPAWMAVHQYPYWVLAIMGFVLVTLVVRFALIRPATPPIVVFLGAEVILGCALFSRTLPAPGEHPLVFHGGETLLDGASSRYSYFPRSTSTSNVLTILTQIEGVQDSSSGENVAIIRVRDMAGRELSMSLASGYDVDHVNAAQGPHGEPLHRRLMQLEIGRYIPGGMATPALDYGIACQKTYHLPAPSQISEIRIKKTLPHGRMRILGVWLYH